MRPVRPSKKNKRFPARWQQKPLTRTPSNARKSHDASCFDFVLPPIKMSASKPNMTGCGLATQELRRTIMQLTGVDTGTGEVLKGLSHSGLVSLQDTCLDNITMGTEGETWNVAHLQRNASPAMSLEHDTVHMEETARRQGELVVNETPWYFPPLKILLLRQRCCYPDDNVLFPRPTSKQFSTLSNCSDATISSNASFKINDGKEEVERDGVSDDAANVKWKPNSRVMQSNKKRRSLKCPRHFGGAPLGVNEKKITRGDSEKRRCFRLRERRFLNSIHQWCDKVMLVPEFEKVSNDPVAQHETCMMAVRKEEETLQFVMQLERHQAIQDRERRRQAREKETIQKKGGLCSTLKDAPRQNNWRRLLSSWSEQEEEGKDGHEDENETMRSELEERRLVAVPPRLMIKGTDTSLTRGTSGLYPLSGPTPSVAVPIRRDHGKNASCSPVGEMQRLLEFILRHSAGTLKRVKSSVTSSKNTTLYTPIPSREGALFPPQSSVFMHTNWVERIIHADDLPGLKHLTQWLGECAGFVEKTAYSAFLKSEQKNATGAEPFLNVTDLSCASFLLPLRLVFNVHGALERGILVDAVSLIPTRSLVRQRGSNNSAKSHRKPSGHGRNCLSDVGGSEEDGVEVFDLRERLLKAGDFVGEPPRPYEALVGYVMDVRAIVQQSEWRSLTMKRLANEEGVEVRRRILAKVVVTLSIHAVMSGQNAVGCTTKPEIIPSARVKDDGMYVSASGNTDTVDVKPFVRPVKSLLPPSTTKMPNHEFLLVAPMRRAYYAVDTRQMYFIAASALKETNETLLPFLQSLRLQYRDLSQQLMESASSNDDFLRARPLAFSFSESEKVMTQISDVIKLFQLEAKYSEIRATIHRNECAITHYNLHVESYCEFLRKNKETWGALYLRTLRLAYTFCVLVLELGILPIPPKYHPFLGPVLQLVGCHGGQKELRFRIDDYLLELEERAKRVLMPLLLRKISAEDMAELDAAAAAVESGRCVATQIMTSLAVPEDVLAVEPKPVTMPLVLFSDVPSIAG
ncbi:hypothetical protein MOQ_001026 [Trypanosoma cruzi marinkellei]|uniref:Uncharacterized protein n=1 Tax=Trypanosoma cruzi marinkellei TaxID=85056 RepID=K2NLW4_TRYCR|nr:hypothetical protein MOQ_001026 [Trypanosoma cruzi marinkellei]